METANAHGWFATTHWSLVLSAGSASEPGSREALQGLCEKYWIPLYSYVRRRGYAPDDAQDLTQEFFVHLLQRDRISRAEQHKGRFRSFLLTSMKHFLSDEWDKARTQKRGGSVQLLPLEFETGEALYGQEPVETLTPEQIYERRWVLALLDDVLTRLRIEHDEAGKAEFFLALSPCLVGDRMAQPYAEMAERLAMTEGAVKTAVHRLRRRYRQLLMQEIAGTVATPEDVQDELQYLFQVLERR